MARGSVTSPGGPAAATPSARQVALLGMPNTGKSTLFNRLTGGDAQIANWPGLTVDLLRGPLPPGPDGRPVEGIGARSRPMPPTATAAGLIACCSIPWWGRCCSC